MSTTIATETSGSNTAPRLVAYGLLAALGAIAANALVRVAAVTVFDVPQGFDPLGWGPIATSTVVGVVGATIAYGLLARTVARPNRTFRRLALVVLVVSFAPLVIPPAFLSEAPPSVLGTLAAMHVTTAVVAVGLLPRSAEDGVGSG